MNDNAAYKLINKMVNHLVHEMVDIKDTEELLKKTHRQVGEHLYVKTDELDTKLRPMAEEDKKKLQIVLMMGGGGTRLLHVTRGKISKHMIDVGGQPISKYTLDLWRNGGFTNFCILTDNTEMGKSIQKFYGAGAKFGTNNSYSIEKKMMGSGGAIKEAIENGTIKGPFINHYPDDLIVNYPNFAEDFAKVFLAALDAGYQTVLVCVPGTLYPYGVVIDENGKVTEFVEKPFVYKDTNTAIYGLSEETFGLFKEIDTSAGPVKIERSVVFETLTKTGKMFKVMLPSEHWIAVNDDPSLRKFESLINGEL